MMKSKQCILCETTKTQTVIRTNCDAVSNLTFEIVSCDGCGISTTNFDYFPEELSKFYPEHYRKYRGIKHLIQKVIHWDLTQKWLRNYAPKSIFEIGFGKGEMLALFNELGIETSGCEMSQFLVDKIKENFGISTFVKLEDIPTKQYDMLLFYNSLEHLYNIDEYMKFSKVHLNESGVVIVTVPNFASKQSNILKDKWVHLDTPRHLTHFTKKSLCQLLAKYNFDLLQIKKGHIIYDIFGWYEGLMAQWVRNNKLEGRRSFIYYLSKRVLAVIFGFFAIFIALVNRFFGDSALIEAHFIHRNEKND